MNGAEMPPTLAPEDFASPTLRTIFAVLGSLPPSQRNLLSSQDALRARGELERVGGPAGLTSIYLEAVDPNILNYSLGCVLDASRQRRAAAIAQALLNADITPSQAVERLSQLTEPHGLPEIEDAANFIDRETVTPPDVIENFLHRGSKMVIGGGSKSFKTWQLVRLALSVAVGAMWLGQQTHKGRVLYLNLELAAAFFQKRIQVVARALDIKTEAGHLMVWNLRGHAADLSELRETILRAAGSDKFDLIIVDPVYKVLGSRDENKAGDIADLLNEIERITVQSGAAVVFGAHFSKGNQSGKESIDRIGGSGVFARDPDTILIFTKHEADDAFTVEAVLRNHCPIEPFVVRWAFPLMEIDDALDPSKLKQVGGREKVYDADKLLALIDKVPLKTSDWQQLAKSKLGMGRATFFRLRDELDIEKDEQGRWSRKMHEVSKVS